MKKSVCTLLTMLWLASPAGPRDEQWKAARAAIDKGLPRTAITALEPIITGAMHDRAYAEAIKAIALRVGLESDIEGNKPEDKIARLQAELAKARPPMKPAMEVLLAHCYWQYFRANQWRYLQRTQAGSGGGADLRTWDLPRILTEIDTEYYFAFGEERFSYVGMHYCPFCGRVLSRELWNREKKKG